MSALVKLSAKLPADPDDQTNGVDPLAGHLVKDPREIRAAIIWFDTAKVTVNTDDDSHIPTIRIRRIEPINGAATNQLAKIAEKAFLQRTGRQMLPLDEIQHDDELDL